MIDCRLVLVLGTGRPYILLLPINIYQYSGTIPVPVLVHTGTGRPYVLFVNVGPTLLLEESICYYQ